MRKCKPVLSAYEAFRSSVLLHFLGFLISALYIYILHLTLFYLQAFTPSFVWQGMEHLQPETPSSESPLPLASLALSSESGPKWSH